MIHGQQAGSLSDMFLKAVGKSLHHADWMSNRPRSSCYWIDELQRAGCNCSVPSNEACSSDCGQCQRPHNCLFSNSMELLHRVPSFGRREATQFDKLQNTAHTKHDSRTIQSSMSEHWSKTRVDRARPVLLECFSKLREGLTKYVISTLSTKTKSV